MNNKDLLEAYRDEIICEFGVDGASADMMLFSWLVGLYQWRFNDEIEYILGDE